MKKITLVSLPIAMAIVMVLVISLLAVPAQSRPALGVTNFDSVHLRDTGPTAQPVLRADQRGLGKIVEFMDSGTPVWSLNNGGGVTFGAVAVSGPVRFGSQEVISGTAISHGLGVAPTSIVLTSLYPSGGYTRTVYVLGSSTTVITVGIEGGGVVSQTVYWMAGK